MKRTQADLNERWKSREDERLEAMQKKRMNLEKFAGCSERPLTDKEREADEAYKQLIELAKGGKS